MSNKKTTNNSNLNHFQDKFWNLYTNIFIRFSWLILIVSLLITISLSISFLCLMKIRIFDQTYFLVRNGRALKSIQQIEHLFGNDKGYRVHQQMDLYPALDIIIKRKLGTNNDTNMLDTQIINEIHDLDKKIQSIQVENKSYSSLCARINRACVIDGNYLLSERFREKISDLEYISNGMYVDTLTGANGLDAFIFGKGYKTSNQTSSDADYIDPEDEEESYNSITQSNIKTIVSYVPIFRLRYALNISNERSRLLALKWEQEIERYLTENYYSSLINISFTVSTSITDAITKQAHIDGPYLAIMILIFFIFVCFFISIQGNFHTSVGYLSLCGIINLALSSGATFGLLAIFQIDIIEPLSFLVFAVAIVDCMRTSIVCGEYHQIIQKYLPQTSSTVPIKINIETIVRSIIDSTCSCFIPSTLIILCIYLFMALLSPMACTKYLGFILVIYMLINHLTHCLFFTSCLIITLKRILSNRHCLFCYHLPNDYYIRIQMKTTKKTFIKKRKEFFRKIQPNMKKFFTSFICFLTILFVIINIWSVFSMDTRLFDDRLLPKNASSIRSYMKSQSEDYELGPVIMFVIPQSINYQNSQNQQFIRNIISQCKNESTTSQFHLLWLDHEDIKLITMGKDPIEFRITPYSQNDLVLTEGKNNRSIIKASRFYCQLKSITGSRKDLGTMHKMYKYADESKIPSLFPYSIIFSHYESLERIRTEVYLMLLFLIIFAILITIFIFFSLKKTFLIVLHLLILYSGNLTCLYIFHNLSFNFGNALWLFVLPIIFLDTLIHVSLNIKKSKWKYNRVILSLIISLFIFSLFPIQTYIFHIIRNSLFYESIICFLIINIFLPSWNYIIRIYSKKKRKENKTCAMISNGNQTTSTYTEIQNLVRQPNNLN